MAGGLDGLCRISIFGGCSEEPLLGTGSNSTIAGHLKNWRDEYAKKTIHHLPANMPKELISAFEVLWQTAMEQAQDQLVEHKRTLDDKHDLMLKNQHKIEKALINTQQKLADTNLNLEREVAEKQNLNIELAIEKDRLANLENMIATQRDQYEDRLRLAYVEKDNLFAQCQQIRSEVKILQEKLTQQAEQHQNILTQQYAIHEQSEIRWIKLIEQAKQEAKEAHKKFEILNKNSSEQITTIKTSLSDLQKKLFEKNMHLKIETERNGQLNDELNTLQKENIKLNSIIVKYEDEKRLKDLPFSKRKSKKEVATIS